MRLFIYLIAFIFVFVSIALVVPNFLNWNEYKGDIAKIIQDQLGYDVVIESDLRLSILPQPSLYVRGIEVSNASMPIFKAHSIDVKLDLLSLMQGQLQFTSVQFREPEISVKRLDDRRYNFMTSELEHLISGKSEVASSNSKRGAYDVSVTHLTMHDASISYQDGAKGEVYAVRDLDLDLYSESMNGPYNVEGSFDVFEEFIEFELDAHSIDFKKAIASIDFQANSAKYGLLKYAAALGFDDEFTAQGEFNLQSDALSQLLAGVVESSVLRVPSVLHVDGMLNVDAERAELRDASLKIDDLIFDLKKKFDFQSFTSEIDIRGSALDLRDYIDLPAFNKAQDMSFASKLNVQQGAIDARDIDLRLNDRRISGSLSYNLESKHPSLGIDLDMVNVNFDEFIGANDMSDASEFDASKMFMRPKTPVDIAAKINLKNIILNERSFDNAEVQAVVTAQKIQSNIIIDDAHILMNMAGETSEPMATVQVKHNDANDLLMKYIDGYQTLPNLKGALDVYMTLSSDDKSLLISDVKAKIGTIDLQGEGAYRRKDNIHDIQGNLIAGDLNFSGGGENREGNGGSVSGAIVYPDLSMINLRANISAKSMSYGDMLLTQPSFVVSANDDAIILSDLKAGLYGGSIYMNANLRPAENKAKGVTIENEAKLRSVDVAQFFKAMSQSSILKGSGKIDLDTSFSGAGARYDEMLRALLGRGVVSGEKLVLEGVDLVRFARGLSSDAKAGDSVLNLWKGATKGGRTEFDALDGEFKIQKGLIDFAKLDLDGQSVFVDTTATVNAMKYTLSSSHEITLKNYDVPPFTIKLDGPLNNPAQTFGQGVLEDYLSRKVKRKLNKVLQDKLGDKLGGALFGGSSKSKGQPANDNDAQNSQEEQGSGASKDIKEEAIKGLLRGLLR